jgi:hypothetical protein
VDASTLDLADTRITTSNLNERAVVDLLRGSRIAVYPGDDTSNPAARCGNASPRACRSSSTRAIAGGKHLLVPGVTGEFASEASFAQTMRRVIDERRPVSGHANISRDALGYDRGDESSASSKIHFRAMRLEMLEHSHDALTFPRETAGPRLRCLLDILGLTVRGEAAYVRRSPRELVPGSVHGSSLTRSASSRAPSRSSRPPKPRRPSGRASAGSKAQFSIRRVNTSCNRNENAKVRRLFTVAARYSRNAARAALPALQQRPQRCCCEAYLPARELRSSEQPCDSSWAASRSRGSPLFRCPRPRVDPADPQGGAAARRPMSVRLLDHPGGSGLISDDDPFVSDRGRPDYCRSESARLHTTAPSASAKYPAGARLRALRPDGVRSQVLRRLGDYWRGKIEDRPPLERSIRLRERPRRVS